MITPAQIAALEAAAKSWSGTPFCEGSPVKGSGVSCHHAIAEIDFEAGLMPRVPVPDGPPAWSQSQSKSLICDWLDASPLFSVVQITAGKLPADAQAGDHLGFRLGHTVHHLGLLLPRGRLVHSIVGHGVVIAPGIPFPWLKRLERVWRLK